MDGESRRFALQSCCKGVGYKESLIKKNGILRFYAINNNSKRKVMNIVGEETLIDTSNL